MAPKWLPTAITAIFTFGLFSGMSPITSVTVLQLACQDHGFPIDCNDKLATKTSASFMLGNSLALGFILLLTAGLWAAVANRLGRRFTMISSILGQTIFSIVCSCILFFPVLQPHWKGILILGQALNGLFGHFPLMVISIYGQVGDITAKEPHLRSFLFTLLVGSIGLTGIIGYQLTKLISVVDVKYVFLAASIMFVLILLFVVFVYPETVSDDLRSAPIDWKRAHIFGALGFILPLKHTKEILHNDALLAYRQRLSAELGVEIPEDLDLPLNGDEALAELRRLDIVTPEILNEYITKNTYKNLDSDASDNNYKIASISDDSDSVSIQGLSSPVLDKSIVTKPDTSNQCVSNSISLLSNDTSTKPLPRYIVHRNAILILGLIKASAMMVILGMTTVLFNVLKQEFNLSSNSYSNILTLQAVSKGVGSFLIVPLLKPYVTSPMVELYIAGITLFLEGLFVMAIGFFNNTYVLLMFFSLQAISSCLSAGFARSLLTNQVTIILQNRILSLITALEVLIILVGGFSANLIFSLTNDWNPRFVLLVLGAQLALSSFLLFLISDPTDEFNERCGSKNLVVAEDKNNVSGNEEHQEDSDSAGLFEIEEKAHLMPENDQDVINTVGADILTIIERNNNNIDSSIISTTAASVSINHGYSTD